MSIDIGIDNLATIITNTGRRPVLVKGKNVKSINQYYNKMKSHFTSILRNEEPALGVGHVGQDGLDRSTAAAGTAGQARGTNRGRIEGGPARLQQRDQSGELGPRDRRLVAGRQGTWRAELGGGVAGYPAHDGELVDIVHRREAEGARPPRRPRSAAHSRRARQGRSPRRGAGREQLERGHAEALEDSRPSPGGRTRRTCPAGAPGTPGTALGQPLDVGLVDDGAPPQGLRACVAGPVEAVRADDHAAGNEARRVAGIAGAVDVVATEQRARGHRALDGSRVRVEQQLVGVEELPERVGSHGPSARKP